VISRRAAAAPADPGRARLRAIINEIAETTHRLEALEQAQTRANERGWHAASQLAEANDQLRIAAKDAPRRLAYSYVNDDDGELADPVTDAESRVAAAQREVDRLADVEAALSGEIAITQSTLRDLRVKQHVAMADVVCGSPQYRALLERHTACWQELRSVKDTLRILVSSLRGQHPLRLEQEVLRAETLEGDRTGYPVNAEPGKWAAALTALENDADAELPKT